MRPAKLKVYQMTVKNLGGFALPKSVMNKVRGDYGNVVTEQSKPPELLPAETKLPPLQQRSIPPKEPGYREQCRAKVRNDELGKLVVEHAALLSEMDFNSYVQATRNRGDLLPNPSVFGSHPAFPFLKRIAKHGVPVVTSSLPWTEEMRQQQLKRGPHKSCNEHLKFLRAEMAEFVTQGYWSVVPYRTLMKTL